MGAGKAIDREWTELLGYKLEDGWLQTKVINLLDFRQVISQLIQLARNPLRGYN
jgi:hypothetical protein